MTGSLATTEGTSTLNAAEIVTEAVDLDNRPNDLSLYSQTRFVSVIWPGAYGYPESELDVAIAFGTDSSLTVTSGWDDVTGWGEPNGLHFMQGVTGKLTGAKPEEK